MQISIDYSQINSLSISNPKQGSALISSSLPPAPLSLRLPLPHSVRCLAPHPRPGAGERQAPGEGVPGVSIQISSSRSCPLLSSTRGEGILLESVHGSDRPSPTLSSAYMGKWALGINAKQHEHVSAVSHTLLGEVDSFRGSQGHCQRIGGPRNLHQNVLKSPESLSRGSRNHQGAAVWALPPPFTDRKRKVQRETASSPRSHSLLRMEGKPEDKFGSASGSKQEADTTPFSSFRGSIGGPRTQRLGYRVQDS